MEEVYLLWDNSGLHRELAGVFASVTAACAWLESEVERGAWTRGEGRMATVECWEVNQEEEG